MLVSDSMRSISSTDLISDSLQSQQQNAISALATPSRTQRIKMDPRRRRLKLFRKKTFLVNEPNNDNNNTINDKSSDNTSNMNSITDDDKNKKLRIVQFSEETALSKSIRRKTSGKLDGILVFTFALKTQLQTNS